MPSGIRLPEPSPENETLEHFERFCWTLRVPETGDRFKLIDWQLTVLEDYFSGGALKPEFFEHLWEIPTGNGKSGLFGAMALHHGTYVASRPRVFVVGGEMEHARNTTNAATAFVNESRARNGLLGYWWEGQEHSGGRVVPLWLPDPDVGIFARSAGRSTAAKGGSGVEGKNPTLILVEEFHRHEDGGSAVNTLKTKTIKAGAVGRAVKCVTITTAGTSRRSPLGEQLARAVDVEAGAEVKTDLRPGEYHKRGVDADRDMVAHIWEVPEAISPPSHNAPDEELVQWLGHVVRANPAPWITVPALKRIWRTMSRFERWMFLRQNANQWVAAGFSAIDRGQWWDLYLADLQIPAGPGIKVHVGLDRASKWDATAIVPVWKIPDDWRAPHGFPQLDEDVKVLVSGAVILESPRDGTRRKTRDVAKVLKAMKERWPDMVVVFDRNHGGGDVAEDLEESHGLEIVDHSQGTPFDLASMRLGEYVEERKLRHGGGQHHELFSTQVLSAVLKETAAGRRWRGEAPDDETPADGFDALAMALNIATAGEEVGVNINPDDYRIQTL